MFLLFLVAELLAWMAYERMDSFNHYHRQITHESLNGVTNQIARYVDEKRRSVKLFAREHIDYLRVISANPNSEEVQSQLHDILGGYFPEKFAFSVADRQGNLYFEDFDGLVSEQCEQDLKEFSHKHIYEPYVHPNPLGYHFDIITGFGANEGLFLVSFKTDVIRDIIKSVQSPEHRIMLITEQKNGALIEITADGARNTVDRDDYYLSQREWKHISNHHHPIPGTRWRAVEVSKPELFNDHLQRLIFESMVIFLLFSLIAWRLAKRLRKAELQREAVERQKTELMGLVSHEFRTPACVIKNALDLVLEGDAGDISQDTRKYLNMANTSTSSLLLLVDDFLDLQSLESGSFRFNKRRVTIDKLVKMATENNRMYGEKFHKQFEIVEPLLDTPVDCDEKRIEQVLANLLSNAVKYGAEQDTIKILTTANDEHVRISVVDHGEGIPEHLKPKIFEKFTMGHNNKRNLVNSTGLGLSIAKLIVEKHEGTIGFDSTPGSGTTFWFELPAEKSA